MRFRIDRIKVTSLLVAGESREEQVAHMEEGIPEGVEQLNIPEALRGGVAGPRGRTPEVVQDCRVDPLPQNTLIQLVTDGIGELKPGISGCYVTITGMICSQHPARRIPKW